MPLAEGVQIILRIVLGVVAVLFVFRARDGSEMVPDGRILGRNGDRSARGRNVGYLDKKTRKGGGIGAGSSESLHPAPSAVHIVAKIGKQNFHFIALAFN